jgi:hypothetical protein
LSETKVETIYCDDIRSEMDGKQILIGVYGPEIVVSKLPSTSTISLWVRIKGLPPNKYDLSLTLSAPNDSDDRVIEGNIEPQLDETIMALSFVRIPVKVQRRGLITARLKIGEYDFELDSLKVRGPEEEQVTDAEEAN